MQKPRRQASDVKSNDLMGGLNGKGESSRRHPPWPLRGAEGRSTLADGSELASRLTSSVTDECSLGQPLPHRGRELSSPLPPRGGGWAWGGQGVAPASAGPWWGVRGWLG